MNAALFEIWKNDDELFYETKGSELVYNKLKDCSCVLVTANLGSGKTATIRHIALKLQLGGFEIVPVQSPDDIIKYTTTKKQVFLIDDVLGKYHLSPTLLEKWERVNEKLMRCLDTELGSNKILCTMRSQIALHERFKNASTILNKEVICLEREINVLSKEEKQKILIEHIKRNKLDKEIRTEEIGIMCETNYAFPLLCKLVSSDGKRFRKRIKFFNQPFSVLKEELDEISNENKKLYCILVLCMLFNGSLSRIIFDIDSYKCDEKIIRIMQTCGLPKTMSKKELEDSAYSAIGSYFIKVGNKFRFIHDVFEETVGCHFYTFNPKVLFSDCDILFIRDRVRVQSIENMNEHVDENIVIIQEDELNETHFNPLFDRLSKELRNGRFSSLLMSHLFKNKSFVCKFGTHFENTHTILELKHHLLKTVSSERKRIKAMCLPKQELVDKRDAIIRVIEAIAARSTLMYWIVAFGCYEFFNYAWSKISTLDRVWVMGRDYIFLPSVKSFFPLAVFGGSFDIVQELILSGADVNCISEFLETPLHIAVYLGRYDMVRLLIRNGAQINLRGWFTMHIPIAITSNKHELTSLILEYDLTQTELHKAVRNNNLENLRSKIRSENINYKTKSEWTPLQYAVLLNNVDAVKALLQIELPQNDDPSFDITQIDQREGSGRKPTPKINIAGKFGLTAIHVAVINNNIEIISLLLRNRAEINIRDDFDRTPLHYTRSENAINLLLTFICRNKCLKTNRNTEEGREYKKQPISAFRTVFFDITLQTSFRNVCRDCVNIPDRDGNTPLHSVITRCLLKEESRGCIEKIIEYGGNPYLSNNSGTSALDLVRPSCDTDKYMINSAKYIQSIEKTYKVFGLFMLLLMFVTFGIAIKLSYILRMESYNTNVCIGQVAESGSISLVQVTRSINNLLFTIVLFWLMSLTFYLKYSYLLCHCFVLLLLGSVSVFSFGAFAAVQILDRFMYSMICVVVLFSLLIKIMLFVRKTVSATLSHLERGEIACLMLLLVLVILCNLVYLPIAFTDDKTSNQFNSIRNINTLNITASNCSAFSSVNFSCISLANNITYKKGVDFSVECYTDPNITTYDGTLTLESGIIDWSEILLMSSFFFNLSLHATCVFCFLHCILVILEKRNFQKKCMYLNIRTVFILLILYIDILSLFYYLEEGRKIPEGQSNS